MHTFHPKLSYLSHPKLSEGTLCTSVLLLLLCLMESYSMWQTHASWLGRINVKKNWKHPSSKSITTKTNFFSAFWCACLSPNLDSSQNLKSHPPHPSSKEKEKNSNFLLFCSLFGQKDPWMKTKIENDQNGAKIMKKRNSKLMVGKVLLV